MKALWTTLQFTLGFVLGITMFAGVSLIMAYFFLSQLAKTPPKPMFAEIVPETVSKAPVIVEEEETETEIAEPSEPELDVYRARVTWSDGLTIRAEPNVNSERLGGAAYNQELVVFGGAEVEGWQKILVPGADIEGWVKAGNLERVN